MNQIKTIEKVQVLSSAIKWLLQHGSKIFFRGSGEYWETRYAKGGTSGEGSYGKFAEFKAQILNTFVEEKKINFVIEFGCGDGNQVKLARYPFYVGLDVAKTAIKGCIERFKNDKTKSFFLYSPDCFADNCSAFKADLSLSLDVVYHLVEDEVYNLYIRQLFASSEKFVIVYSSDSDCESISGPHVRHRNFSKWVEENLPQWRLVKRIPNRYAQEKIWGGYPADFFIYERLSG